jgi:hypothetical protein
VTIAAAYLVSDGVVFGADSATTVSVKTPDGRAGVLQVLNHTQKIFEVGENSRFGVCTWGAGSVGSVSHRTIIARLAEEINEETTVEVAARKLGDIVEPLAKGIPHFFVGYYLGGWHPKTHDPACFQIQIGNDGKRVEPLGMGVCSFSGNPLIFTRVFRGFDARLPDLLLGELKGLFPEGEARTNFDAIFKRAFEKATEPLVAAGHKDLPIREALDFVYTYLHITIKTTKFMFGAPDCGGSIEIGFVSTDRRFRWGSHKGFASAILEQGYSEND